MVEKREPMQEWKENRYFVAIAVISVSLAARKSYTIKLSNASIATGEKKMATILQIIQQHTFYYDICETNAASWRV